MKIQSVSFNNRRKGFRVRTAKSEMWYPYARLHDLPRGAAAIVSVSVDPELAREGFTYRLASGREGSVHVEQVLEYNQDPAYLRDLLLYKLTLEAQKRIGASRLSRREIIRRMGTSASQLYRLLDQTNSRKSVDQMLALLHVLDCDVDLVVRSKSA
jgi:hypothetical protein